MSAGDAPARDAWLTNGIGAIRPGIRIKGRCSRHIRVGTAATQKGWPFLFYRISGNRESGSAKAIAQGRQDLFPLGNRMGAEEGNAAGGLANAGPNLESLVAGAHMIGGKSKAGREPEGFSERSTAKA